MKTILVTGGSGFIGTNFIHNALTAKPDWYIVNLDALTYSGNPVNFEGLPDDRYKFIKGSITDSTLLRQIFSEYKFNSVFHFAAESHVDQSIIGSEAFVKQM